MANKDMLVANLERCQEGLCDECPYQEEDVYTPWDCPVQDDALGLLKEQDPFDTSIPPGGYLEFTIDADMRSRIIQAAEKAVEASYECGDFVDRTEVETEVLAGLLKIVKEQESVRQGSWYERNDTEEV